SSRRRHTRFSRDWSSDVCSSDLDLLKDRCLADACFGCDDNELRQPDAVGHLLKTVPRICYSFIVLRLADFIPHVLAQLKAAGGECGCRSEERRVGQEWSTSTSKA